MTTVECAVLAFKLLAVWVTANGLIGMAHVPAFWTTDQAVGFRGAATVAAAFPLTLSIVLGGLVWLNASWLAARVFVDPEDLAARVFGDGPEDPPVPRGVARLEPFFALAVSVIGVLMVVEAAPPIIQGTTLFALSRRAGSAVLGPDPEQRAALWNAVAMADYAGAWTRLLIGVAMLAGPARLGAAYARIRKELKSTLDDDTSEAKPPTR